MSEGGRDTTIFIVDDNPDVLESCSVSLAPEYDVRTATSGPEALERIDDTVDVVFLDRRMPDMTGDEVLGKLRQEGYDMSIAMLTGVMPDSDIIEMPFDDYIEKPVDISVLRKKVEILTNWVQFEQMGRELYALASKKASLEVTGLDGTDDQEYQEVLDRIEEIQAELLETLETLAGGDQDSSQLLSESSD